LRIGSPSGARGGRGGRCTQASPGYPPRYATQTVRVKVLVLHVLVHLVMDCSPELLVLAKKHPETWRMSPATWYRPRVVSMLIESVWIG
jgi:hypothetical protein